MIEAECSPWVEDNYWVLDVSAKETIVVGESAIYFRGSRILVSISRGCTRTRYTEAYGSPICGAGMSPRRFENRK